MSAVRQSHLVVFAEAVVLFLLVWQGAASLLELADTISSPLLVWAELTEVVMSGEWIPHFAASLKRIIYGFIASVVVGVALGLLFGINTFWREALRYFVLVGLAMPGLLVVIFTAMAYGISDLTPVVSTVLLTTPFLIEIVQSGVEDIDSSLLRMSGSFNVPRRRVYRRVVVPSILPEIFSSIRLAFSVAWKITILAEVIIASVGVGFVIRDLMNSFSMTGVLAYLILFIGVMMIIEYGLFRQIEKRAFDWREDVSSSLRTGAGVQ